MSTTYHAVQHRPFEWYLQRTAQTTSVSSEVTVVITGPGGEWRVPAFPAADGSWGVRFAPPEAGTYRWTTITSDPNTANLPDGEGVLQVDSHDGEHPLFRHGSLEVAADSRHLQFRDGTPFFWLGDTWWMGFTSRLGWPDEFQELVADRVAKGFTLVQIVAGIYPDMPYGDPRGENEAGLPYDQELTEPNPAWWDLADLKVRSLVRHGLVPCIVGSWGYHISQFGVERLERHWRHLIARWGAYPVIWCLAGEGAMPYYLSEHREEDARTQRTGWTELARYVRGIDPMKRPLTIHPTQVGREQVDDPDVLDFDMLQTGHDGRTAIGNTVRRLRDARDRAPTMPVVIGEVIYEGILHDSDSEKQRLVWWASMLCGAAGFTYGANGLWQVNEPGNPYGPSPHGGSWGDTPWREAAALPGSRQVGLCSRFLRRFAWQNMEPHPEWVEPTPDPEQEYHSWYAAGVPGEFRLVYFYAPVLAWTSQKHFITALEPEMSWHARWFDPRTGTETEIGMAQPDGSGRWQVPIAPEMKDYLLVLVAETPGAPA